MTIGLGRRYGRAVALAGVDLVLAEGALVGLLGPNGAGKSTLLRVLATLTRPDAGSAAIGGHDVVGDSAAVRRRIGYVGHRALLHPFLTVAETLEFTARLHGLVPDRSRIDAALELTGLVARRDSRVDTLSRGLTQRLSLARALLPEPSVLLLDEPHTGLDSASARALDDVLSELSGRGRTVLFASHDLERALAMCDDVVVLRSGRVVSHGSPSLLSADQLQALVAPVGSRAGPVDATVARVSVPDARVDAPVAPIGAPGARVDAPVAPADHAESGVARTGTLARTRASAPAPAAPAPTGASPSFAGAVAAMVWKDIVVEARAREVVPPVVVFALLMVVVFQFAMPASLVARQTMASGALWVALLFGSTLGLSRLVAGETESGGIEAILVSPVDRGAVFTGKWLSGMVFSAVVAAVLLPAFVALLGLRIDIGQLAALAAVLALGLVGWVAAGVLLAFVAETTRARDVLLPVLLFPLVMPLVVAGVQATASIIGGGGADLWRSLVLMAAFDVVFWVLGFLLLGAATET